MADLNRIQHLLNNPYHVLGTDLNILKSEVEKYPYFYQLRAIYLLALKQENHPGYNEELKRTAAYSTDRVSLYQFLEHPVEKQKTFEPESKEIIPPAFSIEELRENSIQEIVSWEDSKHQLEVDSHSVNPIFAEDINADVVLENDDLDLVNNALSLEDNEEETIAVEGSEDFLVEELTDEPQKMENIAINISENQTQNTPTDASTFTFLEWIKLKNHTSEENLEDENEETEDGEINEKKIKFQLIDEFLEKSPKISPVKKNESTSVSSENRPSVQEEYSDLMTETLAIIYMEQKKYDKAIRAYKILSLKYPEKSVFFADRIKDIQKLKNIK